MTVEMTLTEAELLIGVLAFAEGAAAMLNPPLIEALKDLRPWRSALLGVYLSNRYGQPQAVAAVDPVAASSHGMATRD